MRFMVIVKASKNSEAGLMPDKKLLQDMGNFNQELIKAGVMLAGEGLHASSKGARVTFSGDKRTVTDGPFAETKEALGGFYILDCKDMDEALAYAAKCPGAKWGTIEVRPVIDFNQMQG